MARVLTGSADSGTADDPQRTGVSTAVHKPGRELGDPKELLLGFLDYFTPPASKRGPSPPQPG
jgi:hypothetical protein